MHHFFQPSTHELAETLSPRHHLNHGNPALSQSLASLRTQIIRTTKSYRQEHGEHLAQSIVHATLQNLWEVKRQNANWGKSIKAPGFELELLEMDADLSDQITEFSTLIARASPIQAAYDIGMLYACLLPKKMRSGAGMYFTPPALAKRLVDMATKAGTDWSTARVLEPSCGSGTVLLAALNKMMGAYAKSGERLPLEILQDRLVGQEKDPFCAWIAQVLVDLAVMPIARGESDELPTLVACCNTLEGPQVQTYDLVIGNPPFGPAKLTSEQKAKFQRSLYGRPSLPAVFLDQALSETVPDGVICFVTPTSLISGAYSKDARALLRTAAHPIEAQFIEERTGVFEGVTQSMALLSFRRGAAPKTVTVSQITMSDEDTLQDMELGPVPLPSDPAAPWILPRRAEQVEIVQGASGLLSNLTDWGYKASTGPVIWNRFKERLAEKPDFQSIPLIWAESVSADGGFTWSADRKGNRRWFRLEPGEAKLTQTDPCVLVQRTTSPEQARRVNAALLPFSMLREHGAVAIENHLNVVKPIGSSPIVPVQLIAAFLNSPALDQLFRAISGSCAVSATELMSLPLPCPSGLGRLARLVACGEPKETIDNECRRLILSDGF